MRLRAGRQDSNHRMFGGDPGPILPRAAFSRASLSAGLAFAWLRGSPGPNRAQRADDPDDARPVLPFLERPHWHGPGRSHVRLRKARRVSRQGHQPVGARA